MFDVKFVTHCFVYINQTYFDSFGCSPLNLGTDYIIKRNGEGVFSEKKFKERTVTLSYSDVFVSSFSTWKTYMSVLYLLYFINAKIKNDKKKSKDWKQCEKHSQ